MTELIDPVVPTGIVGLDDILRGGLPERCLYLIAGLPGTGKTTMAMQFLLEGVRAVIDVSTSASRKPKRKSTRSREVTAGTFPLSR